MPATTQDKRIDELMEQASVALEATRYFEAERLAARAMGLARQAEDFDRMARIVLPLQEARRQRVQMALDIGTITIIDTPMPESGPVEPGCYMIRPPLVGADARRLRLLALEQDIPVVAVCREPRTQLRLCPVVAIAPGITVRTKIDEPDDPDTPDLPWFVDALAELGDSAIRSIDPTIPILRRIDQLLLRLDALPEHESLHLALTDACREAQREQAE